MNIPKTKFMAFVLNLDILHESIRNDPGLKLLSQYLTILVLDVVVHRVFAP